MNLVTSLLLLLASSRVFGKLFQSFGYSAIIGEIFAGFLLGPAIFNLVHPGESLEGIIELAILLLIFSAGLEINLENFVSSLGKKGLLTSLFAFTAPFSAGLFFGFYFNIPLFGSMVIGLCFAATSIPIALRFLTNFNLNNTSLGNTVMASAVVIEVISLFILGVTFKIQEDYALVDYFKLIAYKSFLMFAFCSAILFVNRILRAEIRHMHRTQKLFANVVDALGEEAIFGLAIIFVLIFSTVSESIGFHFIIGAFFGGMLISKDIIGSEHFKSLDHTLNSITEHFFTPIFFAYLGLLINLEAFDNALFVGSLIIVGYGSKIIGSWIGLRLSSFNRSESLKAGIILNSRGTFDLVVAGLALSKSYIDTKIFSVLVVFSILSIVFNPVVFRQIDKKPEPENL